MNFDITTIIMLVVLAALVIFMFRSSRKRQRQAQELAKQVTEGAHVMTNFGLYGTILEIDEENNIIILETAPGQSLRVHRQTVNRVLDENETTTAGAEGPEAVEAEEYMLKGEPEYGERIERTPEVGAADASKKPKAEGPVAD